MLAVSDTSPVSNLASIDRLELLKFQFSELWIPAAVSSELAAHPEPFARAAIQAAIHDEWIKTAVVCESNLLSMLRSALHLGEAEAIALAVELEVDMVIIDEQEGRRAATQAGLSVTGVLGVLLRAKRAGQIPAVASEIRALRAKGRFFIAPALEARIIAAAGEEPLQHGP